jgi:hypothetical protein
MRSFLLLLAPILSACVQQGSFSGTIVDGLTGAPRADLVVLATSDNTSDMTCKVKEGKSDASGVFTIAQLCGDGTYTLKIKDETLLVEGSMTTPGAESVTGQTLKTWRAPSGDGIQILSNDGLTPMRTFTDVKYETKIDDPTMKVAYPYVKPTGKVATVNPGEYFVISGKNNLERLSWRPLIADPAKRTFVDGSITDHVWVGTRFVSDTEWQPVTAQLDVSKVKVVKAEDREVHYIGHDALPEGRYALFGDKDARMFIVDFGKSFAPAKDEASAE